MPTKRKTTGVKRKKGLAFCTECGESLQDFWLESGSLDVQSIVKRMANCKAEGKFQGNFCARLWIAGDDSFQRPRGLPRVPKKKVNALRDSILSGIKRGVRTESPLGRTKRKGRK
jgi:hypothetical protein